MHDRVDGGRFGDRNWSDERELRQARLEARRQQEDVEETVAEHEASIQSLPSLLLTLGSQGVEVVVEILDQQLTGRIVHVGADLVGLSTVSGHRHDLRLGAIVGIRTTSSGRHPVVVTSGHPHSVLARLRDAAVQRETLSLSRTHGAVLTGTMQAVSESHVQGLDRNGQRFVVPTEVIVSIGI